MRFSYSFSVKDETFLGFNQLKKIIDIPLYLVKKIISKKDYGSFELKNGDIIYFKKVPYKINAINVIFGYYSFEKNGNLVLMSKNGTLIMTYGIDRFSEIIDNLFGWIAKKPIKNSKFALK